MARCLLVLAAFLSVLIWPSFIPLVDCHGSHPQHTLTGTAGTRENVTFEEAQDVVTGFQDAMARANAAIRKRPQKNKYEVYNKTSVQEAAKPAPYLEYDTADSTVGQKLRRRFLRRQSSNETVSSNPSMRSYTIPPEVVEAARIVAEANPPDTSTEDYDAIVTHLKEKYYPKTKDTNAMPQVLQQPSGLLGYLNHVLGADPAIAESVATSKKPAPADFWMENIAQRGSSPFAPTDYQVWRNVKDYGAKGDGVTDDTAAIQLAISDGGRCGANCGGSTVYPATVYFPSGTYIISSSIIMYYNTEMLGNPIENPRLVASSSFVGDGVIESSVYTGAQTEWYPNTNNFLRSVRNFVIDIRAASQTAHICGIHWQAAQGTSLEKIRFYMTDPAVNPSTTQQGIYVENGSGGFMGDLSFLGGKYGAHMGNRQFTASRLTFVNCENALQLHLDSGWTMQSLVMLNVDTGVTLVGGTREPSSTSQGMGSLILTDMLIQGANVGIRTSLSSDNATAFLIMNSLFTHVDTIVQDNSNGATLLAGGSAAIPVDSWGFGRVSNVNGSTTFFNGQNVPTMARPTSLIQDHSVGTPQNYFFTRRRPSYADIGHSELFDVKALGAKGDGSSDDTAVLNHILDVAVNISAVVYFPFGIYMVSSTVQIPVGSRIIGHAWPQIMGYGAYFADGNDPRAVVRVGSTGSRGSVEIQNMMFTVKGATAGAILVAWNVHETSQGSAGLWDSHFRVGGAKGSDLDTTTCPKQSGTFKPGCIAASLLMHITAKASAYVENVWLWTADHDIDASDQTQIDVYSARGILVESQGPTWLWGTSVEHSGLYQYQISLAKNVFFGLIQTESPYFQPSSEASELFPRRNFNNDPDFSDCGSWITCAVSWGVRILDSKSVYILSTHLHSWFRAHDQTCVNSGTNNCQTDIFQIEQSSDIWVYNLVTIGAMEMVSPVNAEATIAAENCNVSASPILAWLDGSTQETGTRTFKGYQLYTAWNFRYSKLPATCQKALQATILCDSHTRSWTQASYHGEFGDEKLSDSICNPGCSDSLLKWVYAVYKYCDGHTFDDGSPMPLLGNYIWYGVRETCQKDRTTGKYCNDVIASFPRSQGVDNIPIKQLCSECYLGRLKMMQGSRYSAYASQHFFQRALARAVHECAAKVATTPQPPLVSPTPTPAPFCVSNKYYTVKPGDTCDTIALAESVSSVDLFNGNSNIHNCSTLAVGSTLCLPPTCKTYQLRSDDSCRKASWYAKVPDIKLFNPWITLWCDNLHSEAVVGSVICASPIGGTHDEPAPENSTSSFPQSSSGYGKEQTAPPAGHPVATDTTTMCGKWYTAAPGDKCDKVLIANGIYMELFVAANPSVHETTCSADLVVESSYCVAPLRMAFVNLFSNGCYTRDGGDILGESSMNSTSMTVLKCGEFCMAKKGYPVFGIQNGNACHCDTSLNNGSVVATTCDVPCAGNSSEVCGGADAVTVFSDNSILPILVPRTAIKVSNSEPLVNSNQYYGCYAEMTNTRALTHSTYSSADDMTVESCGSFCQGQGQPLFGMASSSECHCGTNLSRGTVKVPDPDCNAVCSGNPSETCGCSAGRLSVWGSQATPPLSFAYYNCYTGAESTPALSGPQYSDALDMTVEKCGAFCLVADHYTYFGLSGGVTCMCGNDDPLPKGVRPSSSGSDCDAPCSGNAADICGGSMGMSLFGAPGEPPNLTGGGGGYEYQGCYTRTAGSRALHKATSASSMTVGVCYNFCSATGWTWFGLEYASDCYCGDALLAGLEAAPETHCRTPCVGNVSETCGGLGQWSAYVIT